VADSACLLDSRLTHNDRNGRKPEHCIHPGRSGCDEEHGGTARAIFAYRRTARSRRLNEPNDITVCVPTDAISLPPLAVLDLVADPERLRELDVVLLDGAGSV
jgi:hypothetical protein